MRRFIGLLIICISFWGCIPGENTFHEGDLIFQHLETSQSQAIQIATHSKYSHMGIIFKLKGKYYVLEAVGPVKYTLLNEWIAQGKSHEYIVKRLKDADKVLTEGVKGKMRKVGESLLGKGYDSYFNWSDDRIYCSELVWKIYKEGANIEIGTPKKLGEFDLSNPIVQKKLKERYGDKIPYDEPMISPADMFNSDKLVTVK